MTTEEAVKMLERIQDPEPYEPQITKSAYEALQMGIDALKKEIPTKPIVNTGNIRKLIPFSINCPSCGLDLTTKVTRCEGCGQIIDWSDYATD